VKRASGDLFYNHGIQSEWVVVICVIYSASGRKKITKTQVIWMAGRSWGWIEGVGLVEGWEGWDVKVALLL
jgi:hypothetical protein